jgi:hypothetical protein
MLRALLSILPGLAFLLILLHPVPCRAGAWVQEAGTAYLRFITGYMVTSERYDAEGNVVQWDTSGGGFRNSEYQDLEGSFYAEAGIARGWSLVAQLAWKRVQAEQPSAVFTTYGLGDLSLAVKRSIWQSWTVASVAVGVIFPTGYDVGEYPALGAGETELFGALGFGASNGTLWGNAEAAYSSRGGVFSDQVGAVLGGGWTVSPRFGVRGEFRGGFALTPAVSETDVRFDPATVDPSQINAAGTVSFAAVKGLAIEGEVRTTLWGENTLAGTRWSLALATSPAWRWGGE